MVLSFYLHCSPCKNLLKNSADDKLVGNSARGTTESSGALPYTSCVFTLKLVSNAFFAPFSTPSPASIVNRYTYNDLQKTTKLALKFFYQIQEYNQVQVAVALALAPAQSKPCKRSLKTCFLKLYLGNFYLACYKFCL